MIAVFVLAVVSGLVFTVAVRWVALRFGWMNEPNPIVVQHVTPVAYLGGVGIAVGAAVAMTALSFWQPLTMNVWAPRHAFFLGAGLFTLLGLWDDLRPLRPGPKFVAQCLAAVATVLVARPVLTGIELLDVSLRVLWILTLVNAVNFTDVCDGLVGGLAAISLLALTFLYIGIAPITLALAGACVGFLVWNRPPARIYLGDAGSHLLGFSLAFLLAHTVWTDRGLVAGGMICVMVVLVPLFELAFITAMRMRKRLPWWRGSADHFSLRMQAVGFTKWQTILRAWAAAVLGAGGAIVFDRVVEPWKWGVILVVVTGVALAWWQLSKCEVGAKRRAQSQRQGMEI